MRNKNRKTKEAKTGRGLYSTLLPSQNRFGKASRTPSPLFQEGFTLIDIMIVIVLAGIMISVIIVPFVTGIQMSNKPEMATTAMYLAHQKMEEFMKYHYCNAVLNPTALTAYANITGFSGYQWQWSIYYVDNNFQNQDLVTDRGYKLILVRVSDPMLSVYTLYSVKTRL